MQGAGMFGIGELSRQTECPIETIRYYEKLGLLVAPHRTEGGHRLYNIAHQQRLSFIVQARQLGFSLDKTRELLSLAGNRDRSCQEALTLVEQHMRDVDSKIAALHKVKSALAGMAASCQSCCPSAKAPDCTIVEALSDSDWAGYVSHG